MNPLEQYIRQAAIARGINPGIALRVASSEGGLNNPFRHGEGPAPKSQLAAFGPTENSYGPFQLYISGTNAGLGDKALAAGIDPRKNWKAGVNFALDQAKTSGWGPWYGARAAGITGMEGIGGSSNFPGEAPSNSNDRFGGIIPPSGSQPPSPSPMVANNGIPASVASYATSDDNAKSPLQRLGAALQKFPDGPQAQTRMPQPSATNGDALLKYMSNPRALTDFLLKKRLGLG